MANQQVVGKASLVEFDVGFEIFVLLLVEEVLLGALWNVISEHRVTIMVLRLVLGDVLSHFFL